MKRSLFYIFAAFALTWLVRETEYAGIRMNRSGQFDKFDQLFVNHNNFDLLIIGSSRAESHFRPDIIDSITGLHSYNAGLIGASLPFIDGGFNAYLEHSAAPKYVVLNIDYHMFISSDDTIRHFPSYFPYLSNTSLYSKFNERDHRFFWFRYFPCYSMPYFGTKYLNLSLRGYFNSPGKYDADYRQGYSPIQGLLKEDLDSVKLKPYSPWFEEPSWTSLNNIIRTCKSKHIELILVYSPLYHRLSASIQNEKAIIDHINLLGAQCGFRSMDYHLSPMCFDKSNFTDLDHLSRKGAIEFSVKFAGDLMQYLK